VHDHAEFDLDQKRKLHGSSETGWEDGAALLFTPADPRQADASRMNIGGLRMSALGGEFNRSTQHLLILLEEEVCDGGDCTDMVHAAAEG
jgi:hypothetical protein